MEFGAITGYVDLAQIILYMFWLFFAGLIYYLVRENHREGYPMETGRPGQRADMGWFVPSPKVFKTEHGDVVVPDPSRTEPNYAFVATVYDALYPANRAFTSADIKAFVAKRPDLAMYGGDRRG